MILHLHVNLRQVKSSELSPYYKLRKPDVYLFAEIITGRFKGGKTKFWLALARDKITTGNDGEYYILPAQTSLFYALGSEVC